jgi:hypothetical protein
MTPQTLLNNFFQEILSICLQLETSSEAEKNNNNKYTDNRIRNDHGGSDVDDNARFEVLWVVMLYMLW